MCMCALSSVKVGVGCSNKTTKEQLNTQVLPYCKVACEFCCSFRYRQHRWSSFFFVFVALLSSLVFCMLLYSDSIPFREWIVRIAPVLRFAPCKTQYMQKLQLRWLYVIISKILQYHRKLYTLLFWFFYVFHRMSLLLHTIMQITWVFTKVH